MIKPAHIHNYGVLLNDPKTTTETLIEASKLVDNILSESNESEPGYKAMDNLKRRYKEKIDLLINK